MAGRQYVDGRVKLNWLLTRKMASKIRKGMPLVHACAVCGVSRETVLEWIRRGADGERGYHGFVRKLMLAKAQGIETNLDLLQVAATGEVMVTAKGGVSKAYRGDTKAAERMLQILDGGHYGTDAAPEMGWYEQAHAGLSDGQKVRRLLDNPVIGPIMRDMVRSEAPKVLVVDAEGGEDDA